MHFATYQRQTIRKCAYYWWASLAEVTTYYYTTQANSLTKLANIGRKLRQMCRWRPRNNKLASAQQWAVEFLVGDAAPFCHGQP